MIAMVLAAGFGVRLRPLTQRRSKVSLSLAGVPVIVRVVRLLRAAGVERIVVNLHHAPGSVRDTLAEHDEHVEYSFEPEILGTGGALWGARERRLLLRGPRSARRAGVPRAQWLAGDDGSDRHAAGRELPWSGNCRRGPTGSGGRQSRE
ncbi:MAG: NTP transferase domain-containing protein [Candidatus Glassbacteria bacterium]|nr:NTP transferase domain-containing protein [Candidatus Glassbacteria bacterium]